MFDWETLVITLGTGTWLALGIGTAGHALLHKREPSTALGWSLVCLLVPYFGALAYLVIGINRIERRAQQFDLLSDEPLQKVPKGFGIETSEVDESVKLFVSISDLIINRPILSGNHVAPFFTGEAAFDSMLRDIHHAQTSIFLMTYIFRTDDMGRRFVIALTEAKERGVEVKVLIDGIGERYTWPLPSEVLRTAGIDVRTFLPPRLFPPDFHLNLRNHRKLIVVDGSIAFTGGMNLGGQHLSDSLGEALTSDMHFRLTGPIVSQLTPVFSADWRFAGGDLLKLVDSGRGADLENLTGDSWARVITDGPDDDLGKLALVINTAISAAKDSIRIMTPYFLPNREMIAALKSAALRGVEVVIILPEKSNLRIVDWATKSLLWEILKWNVKVFYQPAPFAHTKLLIVDGSYVQIGSANLDPRSLRLNFELVVEIVDKAFAADLEKHLNEILSSSRQINLGELDGRSVFVRLRDSLAWLLTPYL